MLREKQRLDQVCLNHLELQGNPMTENANVHHAINYIEFSVIDIDEAKRFFNAAFGWEFNDYGPDYAGIRNQNLEGECGGIVAPIGLQLAVRS